MTSISAGLNQGGCFGQLVLVGNVIPRENAIRSVSAGFFATSREIPDRVLFLTAELRKSWSSTETLAALHILRQDTRKSKTCEPFRHPKVVSRLDREFNPEDFPATGC